jgi:hypothetical protein
MTSNNAFVFVVCGSREHIDALHYSLRALQKFSSNEILVVTDSARNEVAVRHDMVVDVTTPKSLSNHQASIYLKTSVHHYLPAGRTYCYLDTDVVALNEKVDEIFGHFIPPIIFAKDHCLMDRFSPSAIKCGCDARYAGWQVDLNSLFAKYKKLIRKPENKLLKEVLLQRFEEIKKNKWKYFLLSIRFNLSRTCFKLDDDFTLNKEDKVWHHSNGDPVLYERSVQSVEEIIESTTIYRYMHEQDVWTVDQQNVFDCRCNHLQEQIEKAFAIRVTEPEWEHWNGGVFLFNELSHSFLDEWHNKTVHIFGLPEWKTRDQGTLIATAWQFGLQNHTTLPTRFNLIADYDHRHMNHLGDLKFTFENSAEVEEPDFIHVYHHWGDKNWGVWKAVEQKTGITFTSSQPYDS